MKKLTFFDIVKTEEDYLNEINFDDRDKSLGELKNIWKDLRPEYESFCDDGILSESDWDKKRTKVMFLLKETFKDFKTIKGKYGPDGNSKTFWRKMQMWTFIADKIYYGEDVKHLEAIKVKEKPNYEVAYVNIKKDVIKSKGAYKTNSDDEDIKKYAKSDSNLLKTQIDLINPNIIICCGTYKFLKHILPLNQTNPFKYNNIWIIDHSHLSNRKGYEIDNSELIFKLKKIKSDG